ncbi:MAG TPA: thioredoxin [Phycisphaerales bacterium]|nr:thioredoxin [Phycisphaerales bacterium]
MASALVNQFTDSNFESEVLKSDKPVIVDFWAAWCPPCRALSPIIDSLADELGGRVKVGKVNTDDNRILAAQYNISSIPTVMIFSGGRPVKKLIGLRRKEEFLSAVNELSAAA